MSWKSEYILKVGYFLYEIIYYKLPQHPTGVFSWHLDVCKSSVYMIHSMMFLITGYLNSVEKQVLIQNINLTGRKKVLVAYYSRFSWRHEASLCFSIGDPGFFLTVAPTMISNRFVKRSLIKYYIIWSKCD